MRKFRVSTAVRLATQRSPRVDCMFRECDFCITEVIVFDHSNGGYFRY
jgi:hypothetical protein